MVMAVRGLSRARLEEQEQGEVSSLLAIVHVRLADVRRCATEGEKSTMIT